MKNDKKLKNERENVRESGQGAAHFTPLYEGLIKEVVTGLKARKVKRRSGVIKRSEKNHPFVNFLASQGINKHFCLNFSSVSHANFVAFRNNPAKFLTLVDMALIHSRTGVTIDRQIDCLLNGLTLQDTTPTGKGANFEVSEL